ncbi:MAG TPA: efflux RND transporter periplasmic adaptor subunit [Rhodocyclaceae bacterium]|nr:efflux RND transporter periplasmic adaptor subunit [Rhodocyclaceae bacterium]
MKAKLHLTLPLLLWLPLAVMAQSLPTLVVKPHAVDTLFPAEATVEAVQQAVLAAQIAGRVLEVRADAGQVVKKGEVLMRLDARESAEAVAAAEAQYINAKAAYERTRKLVEQKFVSPAALDKAKADFDAASAQRGGAAAASSHATIVSPINGIIARRHAELGDMASPGKPLLTIYEPGGLRVTANVPQFRLKDVRGVKTARVEFPELNKWVDAASVNVLPTVDASTHAAQVRVQLPAMPELAASLTPGMFARVHFVLGQAVRMTVPEAAVVRRGEVTAVYVQAADGRLSLRQLRLGEAMGQGEREVLAGLSEGELVVTDPVKAAIAVKAKK